MPNSLCLKIFLTITYAEMPSGSTGIVGGGPDKSGLIYLREVGRSWATRQILNAKNTEERS
jgi:hypothetical protein